MESTISVGTIFDVISSWNFELKTVLELGISELESASSVII